MKLPRHKCGLYLTHNEHKDIYQTATDWLNEHQELHDWKNEEHKLRAISTDEIWILHWYPDTPIGFYSIVAPTLEELLEYASEIEKEE